jgi:oligoendopeptidase F
MSVPFFISDQSDDTSTANARRVPSRAEVPPEHTWDLTPLYPDPASWNDALRSLADTYGKIRDYQGRVGESVATLHEVLEFEKSIELQIEQLNQYASLKLTEDSSNAESLEREARLQSLLTRLGEAFSFVSPEIQAIPDETFATWLADPLLAEWTIPLKKLRRRKPHTLSPPEERLLALGGAVMGGHHDTFSQLTNVDMRFGSLPNDDGEQIELTQSSFSSFLVQRKPEVRRAAFHQFYREFSEHRFTLASTLANSVRADVFYARARHHATAREASLFQDDVPPEVYDNLITAVHDRLDPLFRYLALRKKALKLEELHVYDTYVPLVDSVKTDVPWEEAVEKVLHAVEPLGEDYTQTLRHGLTDGRWCDRYENKGKRSGAFSYGTYTSPPYIMMNYKRDVFSDVYTLAHEAGHSMHTWYSQRAQSYQNYHYPIFLAEVASTFNEILLTEHLLAHTEDPAMRIYLINRQVDDFRGTLYRQTMFAEFERDIHAMEEAGEALTLDSMTEIYGKLLARYFGDAVVLDDELKLECLRIPHFYSAFYVYKYATGLSAAVALATQVLQTGEAGRYLDFLRSGGSKFPLETLEAAGVDMRTPAPVHAALDLFARRVGELEQLLG